MIEIPHLSLLELSLTVCDAHESPRFSMIGLTGAKGWPSMVVQKMVSPWNFTDYLGICILPKGVTPFPFDISESYWTTRWWVQG